MGHIVHSEAPSEEIYPSGQSKHSSLFDDEKVPAEHISHSEEPISEKYPGLQFKQEEWSKLEYVPAGHNSQEL